jgi:chemotaxis protein methyltransferase CheR
MSLSPTTANVIHPDNYRFLQDLVYQGSGIVLNDDKAYLLEARLSSVARDHGATSINDLCALLRATREPGVRNRVIEAMTTNETYFFREPAQYDAIRNELLPMIREARGASRKLAAWSSASSTGQEAYSLAMMLLETGFTGWNIDIVGTDLAPKVLNRAREACYAPMEVNRGLPAPLLVKYFRRKGLDWQLSENVRRLVRFESFDLRQSMRTFGPFDLVFCRNVLVYFDVPTRTRILRQMHSTMYRGAWLLLGTAETLCGVNELFVRRNVGTAQVYVAV